MKTTNQYEIQNIATPAFPKFEVRLNVMDEEGFDLEHLSQTIGYAPTYEAALNIQSKHQNAK